MLEVKERERRWWEREGEGSRKSMYGCLGNEGEQEVKCSHGGGRQEGTEVLQSERLCPSHPKFIC